MRMIFLYLSIIVLAVTCGFRWGIKYNQNMVFPFHLVQSIKSYFGLKPGFTDRGIEAKAQIYASFNRKANTVMIGDSLTEIADWSDIFPDVSIVNRGIGGDTANGVLSRMDGVLSVGAKKAFIMVGINDLLKGISPSIILDDYSKIVKILIEHGHQVYIQSTLFCNGNLLSVACTKNLNKINILNAGLEQLAKQHGLTYINLNSDLSLNGQLNELYTYDGLHLNASGYKVWKNKIEQYIN
jgi:lysophospholipase L1-like esterase